jgi:hypothetical protein
MEPYRRIFLYFSRSGSHFYTAREVRKSPSLSSAHYPSLLPHEEADDV